MARITVTESELADEIRDALASGADPDDAFTMAELQAALGAGSMKTRGILKQLRANGRLEVVRKSTFSLDGRPITVPAYRILKAKR